MIEHPFVRPDTSLSEVKDELIKAYRLLPQNPPPEMAEIVQIANKNGGTDWHVRVSLPPPKIRSLFTKTAVDLKHVLDQAVNAAYTLHTGKISNRIHFPTGPDQAEFNKQLAAKVIKPGVPDPVVEVCRNSRAFEDGNAALRQMCVFAQHKHRNFLRLLPAPESVGLIGGVLLPFASGQGRIGIRETDREDCFEIASNFFGGHNGPNFRVGLKCEVREPGYYFQWDWIAALRDMYEITGGTYLEIARAAGAIS